LKCLTILALSLCVGCSSLGVASEEYVSARLTSLMADVDARVAAGEEFNDAIGGEVEDLKAELGAEVTSILPGILGDQLPVGGGIAGAALLWYLRNQTRKKAGLVPKSEPPTS